MHFTKALDADGEACIQTHVELQEEKENQATITQARRQQRRMGCSEIRLFSCEDITSRTLCLSQGLINCWGLDLNQQPLRTNKLPSKLQ